MAKKLKQGLCINLEGWDGEGDGRAVQKGGDIYIYIYIQNITNPTSSHMKSWDSLFFLSTVSAILWLFYTSTSNGKFSSILIYVSLNLRCKSKFTYPNYSKYAYYCIIINLNSVINAVVSIFGVIWICEFTFAS